MNNLLDQRVQINANALDFTLIDTQGNPVTLSGFQGIQNVLLVFNRGFA
jgi:peroxiredoxin